MARFLAEIKGSRGAASRLGTPSSGIYSHTRGWGSGVVVYGEAQGDADVFELYASGGSNAPSDRIYLGTVRIADAGDGRAHFYPSDAVREIVNSKPEPEALALYFTPDAIRDHFEGDSGTVAEWVAGATDEQLRQAGEFAVSSDTLYETFHDVLRFSVEEAKAQ